MHTLVGTIFIRKMHSSTVNSKPAGLKRNFSSSPSASAITSEEAASLAWHGSTDQVIKIPKKIRNGSSYIYDP
jgi:hypothetical protein